MVNKGDVSANSHSNELEKVPTGIEGLDDITGGGLPKGRPALICESAGCDKTLMSMQFLAQDNQSFGEPGVFVAFEETDEDLAKNFVSLGYNLGELAAQKKILIDYIHIDISEIEEIGEYDLEGLSIDDVGAKRLVLDTIEVLFSGFEDEAILVPIRGSPRP
jgi:circadian clock protein KaiC